MSNWIITEVGSKQFIRIRFTIILKLEVDAQGSPLNSKTEEDRQDNQAFQSIIVVIITRQIKLKREKKKIPAQRGSATLIT